MKGIGVKVFRKAMREAINVMDIGGRVTRPLYGYRFWATEVPVNGDRYGDMKVMLYAVTDEAYKAGVINGTLVGTYVYGHGAHYTLYR